MDEIDLEIRIWDYLQNNLSDEERKEVELLHITSPDFAVKFDEVKRAWESLDLKDVPDPSADSKSNFEAMLKTFELGQAHYGAQDKLAFWKKIKSLFAYQPKYNWAYAVLLVCLGAFGSYLVFAPHDNIPNRSVQNKTDRMQQLIAAKLEAPEAAERIMAVSNVQELHNVNDQIIHTLLVTLNRDPNENVRLVTLDALVKLGDNPKVREGLITSILHQQSELMQVALADAMLKLQEKRSLKPFKRLLGRNSGNALVKEKLTQTIKQLETI